jgi:hypothetical protein
MDDCHFGYKQEFFQKKQLVTKTMQKGIREVQKCQQ